MNTSDVMINMAIDAILRIDHLKSRIIPFFMKLKNVNYMQTLAALILDCLQSTEIIAGAADDSPDRYGGQFPSNKTGSLFSWFFFTKTSEIDVILLFQVFFFTGIFS